MSMEFGYNGTVERQILYQFNFLFLRFGRKEQSDHCRVMAEKTHHWNLKYQTQDPIFHYILDTIQDPIYPIYGFQPI